MDFVSIASALWKQKWLVIPVVLLTAFAALYIVKIKPPVYEANSTVLLTNPLQQVTKSQIRAHPGLKQANPDNIFEDYGDLDVVASAVIDGVTSPTSAAELSSAGAGTAYQLALSSDYGNPPIIDVTGVGSTPAAAIESAQLVTAAVQRELTAMQLAQGVSHFYLIGGDNVVKPTQAHSSSSAKLRPLVVVLGAGIIALFIVTSSADAIERRRRKRLAAIPADDYSPPARDEFGAWR